MLAVPNAHVDASVASDKRTPSTSSFFVESPSDLYNTTYSHKTRATSVVGGKRSRSPSQALRSRSNSFNSAAGSSSGSSGGASFSSVSSQEWTCLTESDVDSPAASQASDEDHARSCPSPSEGKRKAVRCLRSETACDATRKDSEDVGSLDGAVRAFRLGSRDPSPAESQSSSCSLSTASTDSDRVKDVGIKGALVDHLVDVSVLTIDAIWHSPLPVAEQPTYASCSASSLSLPLFIRETLRRSRTSCSTLQAALLYCIRAAPAVRKARLQFAALQNSHGVSAAQALMTGTPAYQLLCGRRNFLAAVMVAAKFLQDRTFSNRAWSKITGLPLRELGYVEREFLAAIGWDLNVRSDEWEGWTRKLAGANGGASAQQAQAQAQAQQQPIQPVASAAPALPASVLQLRAASRPSTASSSTSSSSSSSSCVTPVPTPTATPATATVSAAAPPRSALARTNSDAAPFKAFDVSLSPSGVNAEEGVAAAPTPTARAEATAAPMKSTTIAHPFPMPRAFARSTGSFTFGAGKVGSQQQQQQQQQ